MKRSRTFGAALSGAFAAGAALASEGGEPGGVFAGDIGNALWTLVIFGLVVFVLGKFAWRPILKGLNDREAFIRASLEQAKKDRDEAELRLKEYNEKLVHARKEATEIVEEARRDADVVKHKIEEAGRSEAAAMIERAKREIAIATDSAKKELYSVSADLATRIAEKLLVRELSPADHDRLLREAIDDIERESN